MMALDPSPRAVSLHDGRDAAQRRGPAPRKRGAYRPRITVQAAQGPLRRPKGKGTTPLDTCLNALQIANRDLAGPKRLLLAILEDALHCCRLYRDAKSAKQRRLFQNALAWVQKREPEWIFSFDHICLELDLKAESIRACVRASLAAPLAAEAV